jgi:hypothetical protein
LETGRQKVCVDRFLEVFQDLLHVAMDHVIRERLIHLIQVVVDQMQILIALDLRLNSSRAHVRMIAQCRIDV